MRYEKGSHERISDHFSVFEFDCPCNNCKETLVYPELVEKLEALRQKVGQPILVTSGFRCENHQRELEALGYETSPKSQHLLGMAADISVLDWSGKAIEPLAEAVDFRAVGVAPTWIHVDLRSDKVRRWNYKS